MLIRITDSWIHFLKINFTVSKNLRIGYLFSNCEVYEGEDGDCDYEARHPQDQECQQHHRTQLLAIHLREA